MRGRLHINGTIVCEIRPIDFNNAMTQLLENGDRAINDITGEQWDSALFTDTDLIVGDVTEETKQAFIHLNACFFTPAGTVAGNSKIPYKLSRIQTDLHHRCANLIERGHRDCREYGWSFFLLVEDRFKEQ